MARTNTKTKPKYLDDYFWVPNKKVIRIDYQNQPIKDKLKTCFYCETDNENGAMCIAWGRTTFKVGDIVTMKGRLKDGVFLVWDLNYRKGDTK